MSFDELLALEERGHRHGFLGFLVDHDGHADAAVRVAAARELAPLGLLAVREVGPVAERAHERDREPVAHRLAEARLLLHVVRQVRQRVPLRVPALVGDLLVSAGERHRLEREERDLLRVVERELDDAADLLVVHAVDDGRDRHDVDAGLPEILDRAQLHVEEVADQAMRVGRVADAVELEIRVAQACFGGRLREVRALGELDAVRRGLDRVVADLARVADGVEEVGRQRRLAARELHRHLPARLDRDRRCRAAVLMPSQSSSWTNPTWFASMKHGSHIMLQRFVRSIVSTEPRPYLMVDDPWLCSFSSLCARMSEPGNVCSRCLKNSVSMAITSSKWPCTGQSLTIMILPSRSMICGLDLADLLGEEDLVVALAVENLLPRFAHAGRAERIGLTRPAERRLDLLPRLQERLVGPLWRERLVRLDAVERVEHRPGALGRDCDALLDVLHRLVHRRNLPDPPPATDRIVINGQSQGPNWQNPGVSGGRAKGHAGASWGCGTGVPDGGTLRVRYRTSVRHLHQAPP